jgi:hypothetical protein
VAITVSFVRNRPCDASVVVVVMTVFLFWC